MRVAPQPLRARRRRRILAAGLEGSASRCPSGGKVPQSGLIMLALPIRIAAAATSRELRRGWPYSHCEARGVGGFSQLAWREHRRGSPRPGPLRRRTVEPLHAAALKRPATLGLAARYRHLGPEASAACSLAVVTPDRAQRAFSVLRWLTPMLLPANPTGTCETRARLALGLAGSQNRECRGDRGRHRGQSKKGDGAGTHWCRPIPAFES